jgi:hypothetical protein
MSENRTVSPGEVLVRLTLAGGALWGASVGCSESFNSRQSDMVATAQSVSATGVEGLVAQGVDKKAITSQRMIITGWGYDQNVGGTVTAEDYQTPCDVTVMKADAIGGYILMGVTHCASVDHETDEKLLDAQARNPGQTVSVTNMQLKNLHFDNATLQRQQFGISTWTDNNVEYSGKGHDGISFYFVPSTSLDDAEKALLDGDALEAGDLFLDEVPEGTLMSSICTPAETNFSPVAMINKPIISHDQNEIVAGDALFGPGCSGAGEFGKLPTGDSKMVSVTLGTHYTDPNQYTKVGSIKLSALGLDGIRAQIDAARQDYMVRNGLQ